MRDVQEIRARSHLRPGRPFIDEATLAARWMGPNLTYERALLMTQHHPTVNLHSSLVAMVPIYAERRDAAAAVLKRDPGARRLIVDERAALRGDPPRYAPIMPVPTDEETKLLRVEVDAKAKRLRELGPSDKWDGEPYRAAFAEACWSSDLAAPLAVWRSWTEALAVSLNVTRERQRLERYLGVKVTAGGPPDPTYQPGDGPNRLDWDQWPSWSHEHDNAMRRRPPLAVPVGKAR